MRVPKKIIKNGNILGFYQDENNIDPNHIILPTNQYDLKRFSREITEYVSRVVKDPKLQEKTIRRFEEIFERVIKFGGTVRPLWSYGGSKETKINKDLLDYIEIKLNGVVVLEPVGQINNAMFILSDDESLSERYRRTRMDLTLDPEVYKLSHEANKSYDNYNFEGIGVLEVLEAIQKNKDVFIHAATPQNLYSNVTRVIEEYNRMIHRQLDDEER